MKIKAVILWAIVLVVIEQLIKWIIYINYRDLNIEMIPSLLEFKPTLNNKSFYWLGLMNIEVGRWSRMVTAILVLGVFCLFYLYMKALSSKNKMLDIAFVFGFAGLLCSFCDNLFFGGSWDYVYLKPLFVFDLKDVYLNCFAIFFLLFYLKNYTLMKNTKTKDIVSISINRLKAELKTRKDT